MCSTPEGITDRGTAIYADDYVQAWECSTPEGITDRGTRTSPSAPLDSCWCSTPEGITDRGTREPESQGTTVSCAQRPKASLIVALVGGDHSGRVAPVLNARRHH